MLRKGYLVSGIHSMFPTGGETTEEGARAEFFH